MHDFPKVTVMIATYNSEKLLPGTLNAIKNQSYPEDKIEILIVDGGSTDNTVLVAKEYECKILYNEKTEPVNAKMIGLRHATGKYLVTIDHDEVMESKYSIENKVRALQMHPECKVAFCSGYKRPENYPLLNEYISEFGDPFSLFVYNFPKSNYFLEKTMRSNYNLEEETETYLKFSFNQLRKTPIFELCCVATMIDKEYFVSIPGVLEDSSLMVHLFYVMLERGYRQVILMKDDALVHYSVDSLKAYFPKLKWRVCNNIHFENMKGSGFSGREKFQSKVKYKKYLFIPYTVSCICPVMQSIYLALSRKNVIYLYHTFFCWYVLLQIIYQYIRKILNLTPQFRSYDGKAKINADDKR